MSRRAFVVGVGMVPFATPRTSQPYDVLGEEATQGVGGTLGNRIRVHAEEGVIGTVDPLDLAGSADSLHSGIQHALGLRRDEVDLETVSEQDRRCPQMHAAQARRGPSRSRRGRAMVDSS